MDHDREELFHVRIFEIVNTTRLDVESMVYFSIGWMKKGVFTFVVCSTRVDILARLVGPLCLRRLKWLRCPLQAPNTPVDRHLRIGDAYDSVNVVLTLRLQCDL